MQKIIINISMPFLKTCVIIALLFALHGEHVGVSAATQWPELRWYSIRYR